MKWLRCFLDGHKWLYHEAFQIGYHHGCKKFLVKERCSVCERTRERVGYAEDLQALEQAWKGEVDAG